MSLTEDEKSESSSFFKLDYLKRCCVEYVWNLALLMMAGRHTYSIQWFIGRSEAEPSWSVQRYPVGGIKIESCRRLSIPVLEKQLITRVQALLMIITSASKVSGAATLLQTTIAV